MSMELIPHEKLKRMSAMISGAISFYETDGDMIIQHLKRQQKDGLITGMETMGAALYWLRRQLDSFIRETDQNEKA